MARDDLGRWVPGGNDITRSVVASQRAPMSRRRQRRRRATMVVTRSRV